MLSIVSGASGKMRICGPADFQMCKTRMVFRIFLADVTGIMRMRTQYYNLTQEGQHPLTVSARRQFQAGLRGDIGL